MKKIFIIIFTLSVLTAKAQDPQFSQFYANPLYQSPAMAGSALVPRVVLNYRYQWPALSAQYQTYAASFDYYFDRINSGVGLQVMNDQQSVGKINSLNVTLQYAYQFKLNREFTARFGIEGAYVQRNINYAALTFGSQWNQATQSFSGPLTEPFSTQVRRYPDVGTGFMLYNNRFYIGGSVHHLTRPNQNFVGGGRDPLPMKITVHTGWKIPLNTESRRGLASNETGPERSITPALLFKRQGQFMQADAGAYLTLEPLVLGAWYRGLPIPGLGGVTGINNHDALVALAGFKYKGLSVGYSYDVTVSKLGVSTGGAHEISLILEWYNPEKGSPSKRRRYNPCPSF
jgi:type IX secretion system PorP/SprF family membrane protein